MAMNTTNLLYNKNMRKSASGFTIIELLIVIIVIGIIASISVISYNGVQTRTNNANRAAQLQAWQSVFERYKAKKGVLPLATTTNGTGFCLGTTGFPNGYDGVPRCRDYLSSGSANSLRVSDNAALMTELQTVVPNLPSAQNVPVGGTVGPYVYYQSTYIQIQGAFNGATTSECPTITTGAWSNGNGLLICTIYLNK